MDAVEEWRAAYDRVRDLVSSLAADEADRRVPACPDWTVRDLLSHMIGLDADVVAGDEPDDHNSTWTQRQVETRAGRSVDDLLEEWRSLVGPLTTWMRENTTRPLGDLVIHEQDLRGALGRPGARDNAGLLSLRDRMLGRFKGRLGDDAGPIALHGGSWQWCSSGPASEADVVVRASEFDLARALMSRRSVAQIRRWTERGDVAPYLPAFETLGPLPTRELDD
jgi:uncharacterized protein (TIGR03083 family)